jgi:hypothetical protein
MAAKAFNLLDERNSAVMKPKLTSKPGAAQGSPAQEPDPRVARRPVGRVFIAGQVVRLMPDGTVVMRVRDQEIPCRRASTVDRGWLQAALAVGPVDGEGTFDLEHGIGSLWCVFPGPEHEEVASATVSLVATERVSLQCGKSTVALEKDGTLQVRGRDITTRGSRSARISGGIVRIN